MTKKTIVHCCILTVLVIYTMFAWLSARGVEEARLASAREAREDGDRDRWEEATMGGDRGTGAESMIRVGVPILITVIYGGVLAILYVLPLVVDRLGEEMMGSTAEVDDDPLNDARDALEEEDYAEAIAIFRRAWMANRGRRYPLMEIVKIQRTHLKNPAVAVSTLEEGLAEHDWEPDDAAFLMFRMAEIYEEDLKDPAQAKAVLEQVTRDLKGTRHASNAGQKLREMAGEAGDEKP